MKFRYITDGNALEFDKANTHQQIVFAKYFSPTCPACIAMEDEWNNMCKEIDENYNTDIILSAITPSGMDKLQNTKTYSDVEYVPTIVILKNGKKIQEYDRPKNKEEMINYLLENGYIQLKMKGGFIKKKNSTKKQKYVRLRHTKTAYKRKRGGNNISLQLDEPSLMALDKTFYNQQIDLGVSRMYKMIEVAIRTIEIVLRNNSTIQSRIVTSDYNQWIDCIQSSIRNTCNKASCRVSKGLNNKCIPISLKYNPNSSANDIQNALNAYQFLLIYESVFFCKSIISNYLASVVTNKIDIPEIKKLILNNIFEYKYIYDNNSQSYPNMNSIFNMIAEITVNTVKEIDIQASVSESDITILTNLFRATRILNADFISKKNTSASS